MNLTPEEINQLLAALKTWESEPMSGGMMRTIMSAIFKEGSKEEHAVASKREMDKAERECQMRREASILLQAKLIQMRQQQYKEALT